MADKKLTRKELKAPDAFQRAGNEARDWVQTRQRNVALLVVALVILGAGVGFASYLANRSEERAEQELSTALKPVERPVGSQPAEAAGSDTDTDTAPFKTQMEKDQAVAAELAQFESAHPNTRAAATAELPLAQASLRLAKYDEALKSFDGYLKASGQPDAMRALALEGRGYAYEGKGELDRALAAFDELTQKNKSDFLIGMGPYHRARILAQQKKLADAAVSFQDVQTRFPSSAAARLAGERLTLLAAQGVKPPAVVPALAATGKDAG